MACPSREGVLGGPRILAMGLAAREGPSATKRTRMQLRKTLIGIAAVLVTTLAFAANWVAPGQYQVKDSNGNVI